MTSCVKPLVQNKGPPIVLIHGFDRCVQNMQETKLLYTLFAQVDPEFHAILLFSSCLEWRYGYPLLEESGFETWAVDILGWGFCDLGLFYYSAYCIFFLYLLLCEDFFIFHLLI